MLVDLRNEMKNKTVRTRPVIFDDSSEGYYILDVSGVEWQNVMDVGSSSDLIRIVYESRDNSAGVSNYRNQRFSNKEWSEKLHEIAEKYDDVLEKLSK